MPRANIVSRPTSLKLPIALKEQLEDVAQSAGLSLHAFMIQTLADSVRRTHQREAFAQDAMAALRDMQTSGSGHELGDVRAYFSQMSSYRKGQQPKPPDLLATRLG